MKSAIIERSKRGFSLVEMLIVIAVIAVIATIAVPILSKVLDKSRDTAAKRNAQSLSSLAGQAVQAGNDAVSSAASKEAVVALLSQGVTGTGSMSHVNFRLALSDRDQADALEFLKFEDGLLVVDTP